MATKENPGKFDCYANAKDDEPMFVLLARDELAASLTIVWALLRDKAPREKIMAEIDCAIANVAHKSPMNREKYVEAMNCAGDMYKWRIREATRNA
jgi:hypothetical protein